MKKVLLSIALLCSMGITSWAQAPDLFNYQGIARSASGTPLASTTISLRLTILEGSATGTTDYMETQTATTNQYGLYDVFVGGGLASTAYPAFSAVNWASGPKFLRVEIDPGGASDYSAAGTAQLLSVPYALYAAGAPATGVTSVTAGGGLSPVTITSTGTISMPHVGTAGTYGSGSHVPVITTDAYGRVSAIDTTAITVGDGTVTSINTGAGLTGGPITSTGTVSLAPVGASGTFGSGTQVPVFTTDAYGRIVSVTNTPITTAGTGTVTSVAAGGGLVATPGPITTTGSISMPLVGLAGTYGSATGIPEFTTDAYGRITAVTVNPVSAGITSAGTAHWVTQFTSPTAIGNSAMYNTTGNQIGLGTTTPIATFDAESATDTMAGNFVISNSSYLPQNGVLNASYTGTAGTTGVSAAAIIGTALPTGATISTGLGVGAIGGSLGVSGIAESTDPLGAPTAVQGQSFSDGEYGVAVAGFASAALIGADFNYGVYGESDGSGLLADYAGEFEGDLDCTGTLTAGTKAFKIDHPLDPENKYLYHSCVESNEMMDIYTGNITTDATGTAVVKLPDYMEALNKDFRYQLTVIGSFAQAIISKEMSGNQFEIKTNVPNVKVSWEVTGVRHDAYALYHPIIAEVNKPAAFRGKYVYPQAYGKSSAYQIGKLTPKQVKGLKTIADAKKSTTPTNTKQNNK